MLPCALRGRNGLIGSSPTEERVRLCSEHHEQASSWLVRSLFISDAFLTARPSTKTMTFTQNRRSSVIKEVQSVPAVCRPVALSVICRGFLWTGVERLIARLSVRAPHLEQAVPQALCTRSERGDLDRTELAQAGLMPCVGASGQ
ncbi:hypothetical protein DPEC_G00270860 [Dallia pectoralis]|uniref:Uncharacterized protein n=1 Tax=Dallia pectoralis TaxID=75939 RepID=A0ACC2FPM2_DALPE|nr:hypothetical protein DPEC_G00270860 [Dallia pectoralis]